MLSKQQQTSDLEFEVRFVDVRTSKSRSGVQTLQDCALQLVARCLRDVQILSGPPRAAWSVSLLLPATLENVATPATCVVVRSSLLPD